MRRDLHGGVRREQVAPPISSGIFLLRKCSSSASRRPRTAFLPGWGDEARQADDVRAFFLGLGRDFVAGHHHAHVHHLKVVALQDDGDDVLADVVHVALTVAMTILPLVFHGRQPSLLALFFFDVGHQVGHGLLHHAGAFHHLGRNILPAPNRSPTTFMPSISGPSMTCSGRPPWPEWRGRPLRCLR